MMHEANAVRTAIRRAVDERDAALAAEDTTLTRARDAGAYHHLELDIVDPTRATPVAVQLYAPMIIEDLGLGRVSFDVFLRDARCTLCGEMTRAEPADPVCRACGAPVPRTEGPAIEAHWTRPVSVGVGETPVRDAGSALADGRRRPHDARIT